MKIYGMPLFWCLHNPPRSISPPTVWKSENRGDEWTPISGDLTRNEERLALPIMGRKQSWDNAWDVGAMSNYNTITSLSESPLVKAWSMLVPMTVLSSHCQWRKQWTSIPVTKLGLPARTFVNDIKADLHDPNTVYAVLDNHKKEQSLFI